MKRKSIEVTDHELYNVRIIDELVFLLPSWIEGIPCDRGYIAALKNSDKVFDIVSRLQIIEV